MRVHLTLDSRLRDIRVRPCMVLPKLCSFENRRPVTWIWHSNRPRSAGGLAIGRSPQRRRHCGSSRRRPRRPTRPAGGGGAIRSRQGFRVTSPRASRRCLSAQPDRLDGAHTSPSLQRSDDEVLVGCFVRGVGCGRGVYVRGGLVLELAGRSALKETAGACRAHMVAAARPLPTTVRIAAQHPPAPARRKRYRRGGWRAGKL